MYGIYVLQDNLLLLIQKDGINKLRPQEKQHNVLVITGISK